MDQAMNLSVTLPQLILAMAFQMWMIIFPIFILRKLNRLEEKIDSLVVEEVDEQSLA